MFVDDWKLKNDPLFPIVHVGSQTAFPFGIGAPAPSRNCLMSNSNIVDTS